MKNTQIIYSAALEHGITEDDLARMMEQHRGDLPLHTIPEWSRRGYRVMAGESALFECWLWKHTSKPGAAAVEAAQERGEDVPEQSPHFYQKLSYIYGPAQVEKTPAAPDLAALKSRLDALPGLTYTVKGEKTGAPNVWITAGADAHAETIKALGGVWSGKRSAYWIRPGTAPAEEAPAEAAAETAAEADPAPAPAPVRGASGETPAPAPWKKCSFFTVRLDTAAKHPAAQRVDGYTDGVYNYYAAGNKVKQWHAIHPVYGLSVASGSSRKAAQEQARERADLVRRIEANPDERLRQYAAMVQTAREETDGIELPF